MSVLVQIQTLLCGTNNWKSHHIQRIMSLGACSALCSQDPARRTSALMPRTR